MPCSLFLLTLKYRFMTKETELNQILLYYNTPMPTFTSQDTELEGSASEMAPKAVNK